MTDIRPEVEKLFDWLVEVRRDVHRRPELMFQETRTAGLCAEYLEKWGLEVRTGVGQTGVVGVWRAEADGPTVALRADMDALPLTEDAECPWRSETEGVMHACGHDIHTTMLLGVARTLAENPSLKSRLAGSVKFFFQPAEEGGGGAEKMIEDGALENPRPSWIFAAHVDPALYAGQIGYTRGPGQASVDNYYLTVTGRGGHAAHPELSLDPIEPAAVLLLRLKDKAQSLDRGLLAACVFNAGTKTNIIPQTASLSGTIRCLKNETRDRIQDLVRSAADEIEAEFGVRVDMEWERGYPILISDPEVMDVVVDTAAKMAGSDQVVEIPPSYGAEDMAYFLERVPGAMYNLGCRPVDQDPVAGLHSPQFNPDERVMPVGVELMVRLVERYLGR